MKLGLSVARRNGGRRLCENHGDTIRMNRSLISGAILALLAGTAHAEDINGDNVTLYGILDIAAGTVEHSANGSSQEAITINPEKVSTAYPHSVTGLFNGGLSDPRWGIRGNENLGGGLHAFFGLESGFNLASGELNNAAAAIAGANNTTSGASALDGQLFNRGAFVGLRHDTYGSVAIGRTTTIGYDTLLSYDPLSFAQLFSPFGYSGSYSAGGITEGSRTNNNIKYTNRIGDFKVALSYSFGGVAGKFGDGSTYGADLGYEAHHLGVDAGYYYARDIVHSAAAVGVNPVGSPLIGSNVGALTLNNDEDAYIVAKYSLGALTVKGGYERSELKPPSDPATPGATTDYFGFQGTLANTVNATKTNVYFFGGDYKVTPALDIAAGFYDTQLMQSAHVAGGNQLEYSLLVDYNLSRRTDVYVGYMFSKFNGAEFAGYEPTNYVAAAGVRTTF
jgi:general bacterial porin, GBP family